MISEIKRKLDNTLGRFFFKNLNTFSINLYNYASKKFIFGKKITGEVEEFIKKRYQKIGYADKIFLTKIKEECLKQLPNGGEKARFEFSINEKILENIKNIINKNCINYLNELENYYKASIKLSWVEITRNYNFDTNDEKYSNFFHTDAYTNDFFKIFINLQDVNEEHGPLEIVEKKYSKKFLKFMNINNKRRVINFKNDNVLKSYLYKNQGYEGEILICDTTDLIHRAGVPEKNKFRDIIFLEFVVIPFEKNDNKDIYSFENLNKDIYLDKDNFFSKKIGKPTGLKNLFIKFLKKKRSSRNFNAS